MKHSEETFEATVELAAVRQRRQVSRPRRYHQSRLMPHYRELLELRQAGASIADLQIWLRRSRRISVARSTIWRYLSKQNEGDNAIISK